mmetsp:Transcript_19770/g.27826  ORF Transcript_19770/g.27826 Transcript_19770/m.27826 type:complete len:121 (+) Transcript_19770:103-465(+)|eukprot:CAMPEP_0185251600 /NCGR_PEP_ID=MMETSP1359-20130426/972_1 /TAXON_ID=552665 /ORGANISM="Bigelowiella longifila, Strain CCMP242" /LENGTH=120 /DNA_ID=CAMNT_0027833561 /DNA_START=90 /DNA_END=452 /DNA_ORIENTATION=-
MADVDGLILSTFKMFHLVDRICDSAKSGGDDATRRGMVEELKTVRAEGQAISTEIRRKLYAMAEPASTATVATKRQLAERDRLRGEIEIENEKILRIIERIRTMQAIAAMANTDCEPENK